MNREQAAIEHARILFTSLLTEYAEVCAYDDTAEAASPARWRACAARKAVMLQQALDQWLIS